MRIHHVFIFTRSDGKEMADLLGLGLVEGSNRIHRGQGTRNRKVYFADFFLKLLWVHDEKEARSGVANDTGLYRRSQYAENGASRFGLCLYSEGSDELFTASERMYPPYLPDGLFIEYLASGKTIPYTFRLPAALEGAHDNEPTDHPAGLRRLSKAIFHCPDSPATEAFAKYATGQVQAVPSDRHHLTLLFDEEAQGMEVNLPSLDLTVRY